MINEGGRCERGLNYDSDGECDVADNNKFVSEIIAICLGRETVRLRRHDLRCNSLTGGVFMISERQVTPFCKCHSSLLCLH